MKHVDFLWTSATCIEKSVFANVGNFPIGISRGEDLDLWARIGRKYRIVRSKKNTAIYRTDSENKLTAQKSKYEHSILSIVNLSGLRGSERIYFKKMLYRRLKQDIRSVDLGEFIKLVYKHNIDLFR